MLGFLTGLFELQARVFDWAAAKRFHESTSEDASERERSTAPLRALTRLPVGAMVPEMRAFVRSVTPIAPTVLAHAAGSLVDAPDERLQQELQRFLAHQDRGGRDDPSTFFARAFLQPVAETLTGLDDGMHGHVCPNCGRRPGVSVLRDEEDKRNARALCCSLCSTQWAFPRLTCALCGETEAQALFHHVSDTFPHVRIDECKSCRRYLKGIDLRTAGSAEPVVDEIASVELDVWARDQGLEKGQLNLLGL